MPLHIDAPAAKRDSFHFKPKPLLEGIFARHADGAPCSDHTVPR
jgi:hypothetical protein